MKTWQEELKEYVKQSEKETLDLLNQYKGNNDHDINLTSTVVLVGEDEKNFDFPVEKVSNDGLLVMHTIYDEMDDGYAVIADIIIGNIGMVGKVYGHTYIFVHDDKTAERLAKKIYYQLHVCNMSTMNKLD